MKPSVTYILFITVLTLVTIVSTQAARAEKCLLSSRIDENSGIPSDNSNNYWYCENDTDTVLVFVHGWLGGSKSTWLSGASFWPNIIRNDTSYQDASIFLGGYDTGITSFKAGIADSSRTLFSALNTQHADGSSKVLAKKKIIFIAHSLGGIVVRNMLTEHTSAFAKKRVGLILVASPSLGSPYSNRNTAILKLLKNKLGEQLAWDNDLLSKIDRDFRRLLDEDRIPRLAGVEVLEGKVVVPGLFNDVIVKASSGARYWSDPALLDKEDHFSIVKPTDSSAQIHREVLADFVQNKFNILKAPKISVVIMDSPLEAYKVSPNQTGKMNAHHIASLLRAGLPDLDIVSRVVPVHRALNDFTLIGDNEPDLVIIHYSAWRDGRDKNSDAVRNSSTELLVQFGDWLHEKHPNSKLIIYTRVGETEWENRDASRNIECLPILPLLSDCGFFVSKRGEEFSNFLNPIIQTEFRRFVSNVVE